MDAREIAGIAAGEAWSQVNATPADTPAWEVALDKWHVAYSAWRTTANADERART